LSPASGEVGIGYFFHACERHDFIIRFGAHEGLDLRLGWFDAEWIGLAPGCGSVTRMSSLATMRPSRRWGTGFVRARRKVEV
jgi:hypothetical protein